MNGDKEKTEKIFRRGTDKTLMKEALKEAFVEVLEKAAARFGWFSFKVLATLAAGALIYFALTMNGWHKL